MTEKPRKFAAILKNRSIEAEPQRALEPVSAPPLSDEMPKAAIKPESKKLASSAKSKNPDYVQVTAYLPAALHKAAKIHLLKRSDGKDFSDLLAELLSVWNNQQPKQ